MSRNGIERTAEIFFEHTERDKYDRSSYII